LTFVRNHAKAIVACDFFVVVTASFRLLYVFVVPDQGTRRVLHHNVTDHPTADWTLQQFRDTLSGEHSYRFVIHDRDSIFSGELDEGMTAMGVRVIRTPVRAPKANAVRAFWRDVAPGVSGYDQYGGLQSSTDFSHRILSFFGPAFMVSDSSLAA
jgi:hypothetical protein